jgi:hypothetical protein
LISIPVITFRDWWFYRGGLSPSWKSKQEFLS